MNIDDYVAASSRTECDQKAAAARLNYEDAARVNHAVVGLVGEVGELASTVEKWIYYGRTLDYKNLFEELGDCLWYIAQLARACGFSLEKVMEANIQKLRARYPEKYTDEKAANRDLAKESRVIYDYHTGEVESKAVLRKLVDPDVPKFDVMPFAPGEEVLIDPRAEVPSRAGKVDGCYGADDWVTVLVPGGKYRVRPHHLKRIPDISHLFKE